MSVDLNNYSFEEWLGFVFDHPVEEPPWFFSTEWEGRPEIVLKYVIELFKNPGILLDRYSVEQIEQGFWFLLGAFGEVSNWIWDNRISWKLREETIRQMVTVFENLFTKVRFDQICYMWWDLLRNFDDNPDPKASEAILDALATILHFDKTECQMSALHGLNHLKHPRRKEVIQSFLDSHPNLDEEWKTFALDAMEGRLL